jgi:hypothetical protein
MLELQEKITKVLSETQKLRRHIVDQAMREYFATLDLAGSPGASDFEAAQARARTVLKQALLAEPTVAQINGGTKLDEDALALLSLSFSTIARPLRIPGPVAVANPKSLTLALAGAAGAFAGMVALAPLLRLAFDMRDLGMVLGGPLGALLAVLLVQRLARLRLLARVLPWLFTRPKALRGAARSGHEKTVRASLEQWLDWAVPMLAVFCLRRSAPAPTPTDRDRALRRLGGLVYALHQASPDALPVVAQELIQDAKNSGFEGLQGPPAFLDASHAEREILSWSPDLQNRYETFGDIGAGDPVRIERPAVVFGGKVVQRGVVRKVRDRT